MADPSGDKPSFPQKGSGSDSGSKEQSREHTVIPRSCDRSGDSPPPPLAPPASQPPVTQTTPAAEAGHSRGRPRKKMGKEAVVGMKVVMVEDPGKKKKYASLENLPGRARTCSICRREFPTARALFGHMRSHPERTWRGAHPPPVSPRWEAAAEHHVEAEQARQAQELTTSLLNIGRRMLRTAKFKGKEKFQAGGISIGSSSSGAALTTHATWVEKAGDASGRPSGSSSGDSRKRKKKKKKKKRKKKKMGKALDYIDEEQRKQIHSQIDLNKEAPAEDDVGEEEMPGSSSD